MACPKCGNTKVYFDEKSEVERVCTECKDHLNNESRDMAAVAACIVSTKAAGNPSPELIKVITSS